MEMFLLSKKTCFLNFWSQRGDFGETNLCCTADYYNYYSNIDYFSGEWRESTLSCGSFSVYMVIEHTVLWVFSQNVEKRLQYEALCSDNGWQPMSSIQLDTVKWKETCYLDKTPITANAVCVCDIPVNTDY